MAESDGLIERLRNYDTCHNGDVDLAADMLEFVFGQMQMHSPKMNSQHSYRWRGGWPMTHAVGNGPEAALLAAMAEVKRSKAADAMITEGDISDTAYDRPV